MDVAMRQILGIEHGPRVAIGVGRRQVRLEAETMRRPAAELLHHRLGDLRLPQHERVVRPRHVVRLLAAEIGGRLIHGLRREAPRLLRLGGERRAVDGGEHPPLADAAHDDVPRLAVGHDVARLHHAAILPGSVAAHVLERQPVRLAVEDTRRRLARPVALVDVDQHRLVARAGGAVDAEGEHAPAVAPAGVAVAGHHEMRAGIRREFHARARAFPDGLQRRVFLGRRDGEHAARRVHGDGALRHVLLEEGGHHPFGEEIDRPGDLRSRRNGRSLHELRKRMASFLLFLHRHLAVAVGVEDDAGELRALRLQRVEHALAFGGLVETIAVGIERRRGRRRGLRLGCNRCGWFRLRRHRLLLRRGRRRRLRLLRFLDASAQGEGRAQGQNTGLPIVSKGHDGDSL